jgi:hypothetical protein
MPSKRTIRLVTPLGTTLEITEEPPASDSRRSGVRRVIETTGEPISERPGIVKTASAEVPARRAV